MNIVISGKDFKLTPSIKNYVTEKFGRLDRYHPKIERVGVELDIRRHQVHGDIYRIEVWVYTPGKTFQAGMQAADMRAAIDLVYPKIERQLVQDKERHPRAGRPGK